MCIRDRCWATKILCDQQHDHKFKVSSRWEQKREFNKSEKVTPKMNFFSKSLSNKKWLEIMFDAPFFPRCFWYWRNQAETYLLPLIFGCDVRLQAGLQQRADSTHKSAWLVFLFGSLFQSCMVTSREKMELVPADQVKKKTNHRTPKGYRGNS